MEKLYLHAYVLFGTAQQNSMKVGISDLHEKLSNNLIEPIYTNTSYEAQTKLFSYKNIRTQHNI
jgi:hypothetical protein